MVDDQGVIRGRALIVKEIGGRIPGIAGSVMHADERRRHLLPDKGLRERAVLDEHIHFHAVAEGFMNDHAGDGRRADAFVFARNERFAL